MSRKILWVVMAAVLGAVLGGVVGYGPLLRYKASGVFDMEMSPAEYQRFTEVADSPANLHQMAAAMPVPELDGKGMERLETEISQGGWHTSISKISAPDVQTTPGALLQPAASDKRYALLGVRLTYVAHSATRAAQLATWLGAYFREVAAHEALRDRIRRWAVDSREFADTASVQRLQYAFDIKQAQARAKALKGLVASYPDAAQRDNPQVVDVRKGNEKFMSPMAQMVGAESEVISIQEKLQRLDRQGDQHVFTDPLIAEVAALVNKVPGGSDSVAQVSQAIAQFAGNAKTDAEKEAIAVMASDVSRIRERFLSQAQFIAIPSAPGAPERPSPRMVIVLGAVLAALLAAALAWRSLLIKLLWEDDRDQKTEKAA
ncbi:MAG: hypothetical protein KGQ35_09210 [Burkholderiales bacterium]|nr:hypothetical protein [Burkholderiales bacterium]